MQIKRPSAYNADGLCFVCEEKRDQVRGDPFSADGQGDGGRAGDGDLAQDPSGALPDVDGLMGRKHSFPDGHDAFQRAKDERLGGELRRNAGESAEFGRVRDGFPHVRGIPEDLDDPQIIFGIVLGGEHADQIVDVGSIHFSPKFLYFYFGKLSPTEMLK